MILEPDKTTEPEIEQLPLAVYTERAYLEYSMYVIWDRALPQIGDGLKPVQRRIVYAMSELGLSAGEKYKKSARTIGDVLGKFHPHGDSACYEAMVLMAQSFSYRYPLIDGQGNWGSTDDPKSYAAMRYTESRLSRYAATLLQEIEQGTVDWGPNFDGTLEEPSLLPARLPNILLNGAAGIAVGMATDIPSHNIREVASACAALLENPDLDIEALNEYILAPDYPTSAEIITLREDILNIYRTGQGNIRMRAVYHLEHSDIVITALPYQVSGAKIQQQIAAQIQAKKLPQIADLRDESDHDEPVRLVITPRSSRIEAEALMHHLFATTDLEQTYRVNMNIIGLNGRPQVKNLREILTEWIEYRQATVRRRLQHRLNQVTHRLHILSGLLQAFLTMDEIIHLIRTQDDPKPVLIQQFQFTPVQADAILNLKLRHLARLEETTLKAESSALGKERKHLESLLNSTKKLKKLIREELMHDAELYGDSRRSPLASRTEARSFNPVQLTSDEPITVILSAQGWVRAAKSHDIDPVVLPYKSGDQFLSAAAGRSHQPVIFMDNHGRVYALPAQTLPSARGQGEPLSKHLKLSPETSIIAVVMAQPQDLFLLAGNSGYGFLAQFSDFITKNRSGKAVLNLSPYNQSLSPVQVLHPDQDLVVALTSQGRLLMFAVNQLPRLSRGKGNKIIHIPSAKLQPQEEIMTHIQVISPGAQLVLYAGNRKLPLKFDQLTYFWGQRGQRGKILPRGFRSIQKINIIPPIIQSLPDHNK